MSVAALSLLFESAPDSVFEPAQLETAGPFPRGWLVNLPLSGDAICTSCGELHRVTAEWDEAREQTGRFCAGGGGWSSIEPVELRRFGVDHDQLLRTVARAFGIGVAPRALVEGVCWRLGEAQIDGARVALIAAREMNDPRRVMETARALHDHFNPGHGLVVCGTRPLLDVGLMPCGFKAAAFDDVLTTEGGGRICSDTAAAPLLLGLRRRRRGEHGVAVVHPGLASHIEARLSSGHACSSPSAEAAQLLSDPTPWATPGKPLPKVDAIRMMVSRRKSKG